MDFLLLLILFLRRMDIFLLSSKALLPLLDHLLLLVRPNVHASHQQRIGFRFPAAIVVNAGGAHTRQSQHPAYIERVSVQHGEWRRLTRKMAKAQWGNRKKRTATGCGTENPKIENAALFFCMSWQ